MNRKSALFWILAVGLLCATIGSFGTYVVLDSCKDRQTIAVLSEKFDTIANRIKIQPVEIEHRLDSSASVYVTNIETVFRPFEDSICLPCDTVKEVVFHNPKIVVQKSKEYKQKFTWILDAGHSALTKGKRSPVWSNSSQLYEWEFNRDIAGRITRKLIEKGVSVVWINNTIDPVSLGQRVRLANQVESDLPTRILSIHANAASDARANGVETWFYKLNLEGSIMAEVFQRHLIEATGLRDRGIKPGDFFILRKPDSPAVLTENGFYTNPNESALMLTEDFRVKLADAHVAAILEIEGRTPDRSKSRTPVEDEGHDHDHDGIGSTFDPFGRTLYEIRNAEAAGTSPTPSAITLR